MARAADVENFFGACLLTGSKENQLAMYSSLTFFRCMISLRLAMTLFQFRARKTNACSEVCSQSSQHATTTKSRAVIEKKLRR